MIPMTSARIFRKCLVYSLVFFLTAAMFTACGKKDDETEERDTKKTEAPGRNDLRQSKAAYEIGKFDEAAMSFSLAAQPLVKADKNIALPGNVKLELALVKADKTIALPRNVKLELVKVEAGSFEMSAADGENESDEVPHRATLTKDFYLAQTEVTQAQWKAVMGANPSEFKGDDLPVEHVSWNDAMSFCEKLNSSGKAPNGWKFTLPTETQWEYAARGGKKSKGCKYSGSNTLDEVAWHENNSAVSDGDRATSASSTTISLPSDSSAGAWTHPVGRKKANELGLYDMSGNVYEWCLDDWQAKSGKLTAEFTRGNDSAGSDRTVRGGSFFSPASFCRAARRGSRDSGVRHGNVGFRPALVPESY